jgi:alpha-tubulin suppressor-like RCC1 family protein
MFPKVKFIALTVGGGHGVAITEDRTLMQWPASGLAPKPAGRTFFEVRARSSHSIARDDRGQLYGWGSGLFAPGSTDLAGDPRWQFVASGGAGYWLHPGPFSAIAAGVRHVLALNSGTDSVSGWGSDGDGESTGAPEGITFSAIAAGRNFSIGLDGDGRLHHWGHRMQVTTASSGTPRRGLLEAVPEGHFSAISAGTMHATALRRDARVDPDTIVDRVIPDRP